MVGSSDEELIHDKTKETGEHLNLADLEAVVVHVVHDYIIMVFC